MRQGDNDWQRLAASISIEDALPAKAHNTAARPEHQLQLALGPVPCVGAIMTAPIVLLLGRPVADARSTPRTTRSRRRAGRSRRSIRKHRRRSAIGGARDWHRLCNSSGRSMWRIR
jgi:hypothetical protein